MKYTQHCIGVAAGTRKDARAEDMGEGAAQVDAADGHHRAHSVRRLSRPGQSVSHAWGWVETGMGEMGGARHH